MPKKILVVPDIHGESFWKEPILKYIEQVDRIIFLGDYLDPYPEEGKEYPPQGLFDNLMDIIDLRLFGTWLVPVAVILLTGVYTMLFSLRIRNCSSWHILKMSEVCHICFLMQV